MKSPAPDLQLEARLLLHATRASAEKIGGEIPLVVVVWLPGERKQRIAVSRSDQGAFEGALTVCREHARRGDGSAILVLEAEILQEEDGCPVSALLALVFASGEEAILAGILQPGEEEPRWVRFAEIERIPPVHPVLQ